MKVSTNQHLAFSLLIYLVSMYIIIIFNTLLLLNYIHTYTLLMLPKWAFQLNRIKKKNTNI